MGKSDNLFCETKRILFGIGIGLICVISVCALGAWLLETGILSEAYEDIMAALSLLLAGFISAISVGKGEGQLIRVISSGIGLILLMMLINLIGFGGRLNGLVPSLIVVSGGCVSAMLTGRKKKKRTAIKKRKNTNR